MQKFEISCYSGEDIKPYIPSLAALRIQVFAEYPYLYAGDEDYEARYLDNFTKADNALVVIAKNSSGQIIGCSTGSSLAGHHQAFSEPLQSAGFDLNSIYYFGESVLDKTWRGNGIGHDFFNKREHFARKRGYTRAFFCAIEKAVNDPAKPKNYFSLHTFWKKRGFQKLQNVSTTFDWPEAPGAEALPHPMAYWLKEF